MQNGRAKLTDDTRAQGASPQSTGSAVPPLPLASLTDLCVCRFNGWRGGVEVEEDVLEMSWWKEDGERERIGESHVACREERERRGENII